MLKLCERVGLPPSVLSEVDRWGTLDGAYAFPHDLGLRHNQLKVVLVRVLLQQPSTILVHGMLESLDESELAKLLDVFKAFVDGSLDELTHPPAEVGEAAPNGAAPTNGGSRARRHGRTVMLCMPQRALKSISADLTHRLTIESPSKAKLEEVGAPDDVATN